MNQSKTIITNIIYVVKKAYGFSKPYIFMSLALSIIVAVKPLIGIIFPKFIIDSMTSGKTFYNTLFIIGIMFLIMLITGFFNEYFESICGQYKIVYNLLYDYTGVNLKTDYKNTEDADFLNKTYAARMALYSVGNNVLPKLFMLFSDILGLAVCITLFLNFNILIILFLVGFGIISYLFKLKTNKYEYSKKEQIAEQDRKADEYSNIMSDFSYAKDIRLYNTSNLLIGKYNKAKQERLKLFKLITNKYLSFDLVNLLLIFVQQAIVYAYIILGNKHISVGSFVMYTLAATNIINLLQKVMADASELFSKSLYINDIKSFLTDTEDSESKNEPSISTPSIEFKNVWFKYPTSENYSLKNINLKISANSKLAIVGHNGCGKTTLIKLLCGFYKPTSGEILLNGININYYSKKEYVKLISAVFQDVNILAFSIAENISLSDHYDPKKVNECIEKVNLKHKVESLKNGIDTTLLTFLDSEGVQLSGGQNQRIALARALYKDSLIMVLDEPTSALDPLAEYNLYKTFDDVIGNKLAVYISHRLSSTQFCENVAMLHQGELIEYGSHKELLNRKGKYAEMFNIQAQYYAEGDENI